MFQNNAGVSFTDVAPVLGVDTSFYGWGGLWVDYDNDCFEDLYIATSEDDATGTLENPAAFLQESGWKWGFYLPMIRYKRILLILRIVQ